MRGEGARTKREKRRKSQKEKNNKSKESSKRIEDLASRRKSSKI